MKPHRDFRLIPYARARSGLLVIVHRKTDRRPRIKRQAESFVIRLGIGARCNLTKIRSLVELAFFALLAIITVLLSLTSGLDLVTSLTGAITALCNVGPGLGDNIGPSGNFSTLDDAAVWVLSAAMLLGRLEIMTILVLLSPIYWRS